MPDKLPKRLITVKQNFAIIIQNFTVAFASSRRRSVMIIFWKKMSTIIFLP